MNREGQGADEQHVQFVPPMLLRKVEHLPEGSDWQYEVKWDGYRMQGLKCNGTVRLLSRNGADYTRRFAGVATAVENLRCRTVHMDGEVVAMDQHGRPSFQLLQAGLPLPAGWDFGYYAFDLLGIGNEHLAGSPLKQRREKLHQLLSGSSVRFSAALKGTADQVVKAVGEHRLEGVVAKRVNSLYEPGQRSGSWVKLPCKQAGKFVIGGFRPAGKSLCVLLVGRFDGLRFRFTGKIRHSFDAAKREALFEAVKRRRTLRCPFDGLPNVKADPFDENITPEEMPTFTWITPEVEVGVAFSEWTRMNTLRHPELVVG